jgi:hypothetical protein
MNNMKKNLLYICFLCCLSACIQEESNLTKTFIINNTDYDVQITNYYRGVIQQGTSKNIPKRSKTLVSYSDEFGKGAGYFYANDLMFTDSTLVKFDNNYTIVHYTKVPAIPNPKHITFESSRSLYNGNNYQRVILEEKKHYISNEYTFEFTLQDYLDAKQ